MLWKLLTDKGMAKMQMRKAADISTNILAKMSQNETESMDTLVRSAVAMECGFDDIVEVNTEQNEV